MKHALHPHPTRQPDFASQVDVTLALDADHLSLRYRVSAPARSLRLPPAHPASRQDGLWQHTCCELFVAAQASPAYCEFNFSPAGDWAAYAFAGYRQPEPGLWPASQPTIECTRAADGFCLLARVDRKRLPSGPLDLGLSVVLEHADGEKTYWALHHASTQPDFHQRASFVLALPCD